MAKTDKVTIEVFKSVPTPPISVQEVVSAGNDIGLPTRCSICGLREACLPCDLMRSDKGQIEEFIIKDRHVGQGERLYRAGDSFICLYTVRSGFFKTVQTVEFGREGVTGFHMAGDMLGADGIGSEVHGCVATPCRGRGGV